VRTKRISIRVSDQEFENIARLAKQHGLSRTEYLVRLSTGDLEDPLDLRERFHQIEERLARTEAALFT
jgi:hypothetical protein